MRIHIFNNASPSIVAIDLDEIQVVTDNPTGVTVGLKGGRDVFLKYPAGIFAFVKLMEQIK